MSLDTIVKHLYVFEGILSHLRPSPASSQAYKFYWYHREEASAELRRYTLIEPQFVVALAALPFLITLAEALAPHTWDTPFLFFVGYSSLFLISLI